MKKKNHTTLLPLFSPDLKEVVSRLRNKEPELDALVNQGRQDHDEASGRQETGEDDPDRD
jgi:hypothetical protein